MPLAVKVRSFLRNLISSRHVATDLDAEVRSHLAMLTAENLRAGMSLQEAQRQARLELGGVDQVKEQVSEIRLGNWLHSVVSDCRYVVRQLGRSPGFTIISILTLALAIGANTALFSVINGVLLNPLPYPHPEQLVTLHESKPNFNTGSISYPNFLDWQKDNHTLSSLAVSRSYSFSLTNLGEAEQIPAQFVTSDFFPILGVNPTLGRALVPADDQKGAAAVALVSAGFWKRKLGSASDAVGKSLVLDGKSYTIVGVIPPDFDLSLGSFSASEIYVPVVQWSNELLFSRGAGLGFHGIGRLKPGTTINQARADFAGVTRNLAAAYPEVDQGIGAALIPFKQSLVGGVKPFLLVLFCAVGFVLLIACANIANLLLVRSVGRAREFAVRAALGARKSRLIRQLLTESILLALLGGALGLLLATWSLRAALAALPDTLPRASEIHIDLRVLVFTAAIAFLAGILFGLVPAIKISRTNLQDTLNEGGRGASALTASSSSSKWLWPWSCSSVRDSCFAAWNSSGMWIPVSIPTTFSPSVFRFRLPPCKPLRIPFALRSAAWNPPLLPRPVCNPCPSVGAHSP